MPPKAAASKAKATTSDHASYQGELHILPPQRRVQIARIASWSRSSSASDDMITDAIVNLKDRNGSSRIALKKYVKANNKIKADGAMFDSQFNRALKSGVDKGVFAQPKGSSGGTKLAKKEPKAAAKPKTEKAKVEKKPAAKKATTTKAKPAATKAKAAAKPKAATTKAAAKPKAAPKTKAAPKPKKAAAPKTAPAVVDKPAVIGKTKSGRVTKTKAAPAAKKAAPKKKATPKKA
ncbi:Histone H1 [Lachnellula hyalina]|uniref:Histone H1 n=1 Tax=Lachnellula hyalina TaxID=1316788 RepID=A0A8H8TXT5_9HELO|nr:Histone H1 [Lachnellula hyalina]TVY24655.1 Histone H1 [Lachnellula hyalina]